MNYTRVAASFAVVVLLNACATEKVAEATGGSRADGTVELSYQFGMFQVPKVDWSLAQITATDRCHVWGYSGADKFGGEVHHCDQMGAYGCEMTTVTVRYQCTGHPSS
ncbi:MAG TPA: YecR family lipoprotein [Rhizomicrobium sp.]|nr:YecR family lipoprotein [Rhizomicrobium sp.]